jgi:hypothetical protein
MDCNFDTALFYERVIETVAWCSYWLDINDDPKELWELIPLPEQGLYWLPADERAKFIGEISAKRKESCLTLPMKSQADYLDIYRQGKLLGFFPDCTTDDGVPQTASDNFFDVSNFPPLITWLYYINENEFKFSLAGYLITWIPAQFVEKVQEAIEICADQSIWFLADGFIDACYIDELAKLDLLV